mmetsp:Transcript_3635/g.4731  ORF Transcript_3635/g.4731 Transcript_3635/m.4731 type:complete len:153 (+) Transcript_3635:9-467(+)
MVGISYQLCIFSAAQAALLANEESTIHMLYTFKQALTANGCLVVFWETTVPEDNKYCNTVISNLRDDGFVGSAKTTYTLQSSAKDGILMRRNPGRRSPMYCAFTVFFLGLGHVNDVPCQGMINATLPVDMNIWDGNVRCPVSFQNLILQSSW